MPFTGTDGDDNYAGSNAAESILGLGGNDSLAGGNGNDSVDGGDGNDTIDGGLGNDTLIGGAGNDRITASGTGLIEGGDGDDTIIAVEGNHTISAGTGWNQVFSGDGDDTFLITNRSTWIEDTGGYDTAFVYTDYVKVPSFIENVVYVNGTKPLPYWIDALLSDDAPLVYGVDSFRYGFPSSIPSYDTDTEDAAGYAAMTWNQQVFTRSVLNQIRASVDVLFEETSNFDGTNVIAFAFNSQADSGGYAYLPDPENLGSDVFINGDLDLSYPGSTSGATALWLHEIGHALGLKHTGETGASTDTRPFLPAGEDSEAWTVMSYNYEAVPALALRPLDLAALQYLYGTTAPYVGGDQTLSTTAPNFIWQGGHESGLTAAGQHQAVTLSLEPGFWGYIGSKAATITAPGQVTVNFGSELTRLTGGWGNDYLEGNWLENRIDGGNGNDTLSGVDGNGDTLVGGDGIDQANYQGALADYDVDRSVDSSATVMADGWAMADQLTFVERLHFSDVNLALDVDGNAGKAYRLYQAAFDRKPDLGGLGYQMHDLDVGYSLAQVAANFIASPEFQSKYGNVGDAAFVSLLYQHVLHRTPQQFEIDFHVDNELQAGYSRANVLTFFSESPENQANVIGDIQDGMVYTW